MKKILLGHLHSNGDCLYATAIARQIKNDYPGCSLTWAISSLSASILEGNPYVDKVWEVQVNKKSDVANAWIHFKRDALDRKKRGEFDEIFLTQILPDNLHIFDGTVRSSIFRAYPRSITVPINPVIRLSTTEVENVRQFALRNNLEKKTNVILFECSPKSDQSFVTPDFALHVASHLIANIPDLAIILSSNIPIATDNKSIIDGSVLSFRENAELSKYCTLFVGCSSGISWLCTSDWAKPLPMIQIINPFTFSFASMVYDHKYWNLPIDSIIEMENCSEERLIQCIDSVVNKGFIDARSVFNEFIKFNYYAFLNCFFLFIRQGDFQSLFSHIKSYYQRHGVSINLISSFSPRFIAFLLKRALLFFAKSRKRIIS